MKKQKLNLLKCKSIIMSTNDSYIWIGETLQIVEFYLIFESIQIVYFLQNIWNFVPNSTNITPIRS